MLITQRINVTTNMKTRENEWIRNTTYGLLIDKILNELGAMNNLFKLR